MGPSFFEEVRRVVPSEDWTGTSSARYAKGMMAAKRPVNRAWYVPRFEGVITTRIGPRCPVDSLRHSPFQVPVGFCPWTTVGSWACRLDEKLEKEAACRETKPRARRVKQRQGARGEFGVRRLDTSCNFFKFRRIMMGYGESKG